MREEEEEEKGAGDSCFEESNTMATLDAIVATDTVEINQKSLSGLLSIPLCVWRRLLLSREGKRGESRKKNISYTKQFI